MVAKASRDLQLLIELLRPVSYQTRTVRFNGGGAGRGHIASGRASGRPAKRGAQRVLRAVSTSRSKSCSWAGHVYLQTRKLPTSTARHVSRKLISAAGAARHVSGDARARGVRIK